MCNFITKKALPMECFLTAKMLIDDRSQPLYFAGLPFPECTA